MAKGVVWMGFGCALTVLGWSFNGRWLCMGGVMYVRGVRRWVVIMGRWVASQGGRPTAGRLLNKPQACLPGSAGELDASAHAAAAPGS